MAGIRRFLAGLLKLMELNDFAIPTWLALGATLQLLSGVLLHPRASLWLPLLWLVYRLARSAIDERAIYKKSFTSVKRGRWITQLPDSHGLRETTETSDGVVMFLLGSRLNHPFGKLGPGIAEAGKAFSEMWKEAENNREKWSYLGRSGTMVDTSDHEGTTFITVSYWKDLKALQAFATSAVHRVGAQQYNAGKSPYLGIMHETYYAPKGSWESIYDNFPPWGLGAAKVLVGEEAGGLKLGDTLVPIPNGSHMFDRMKRKSSGQKAIELA